MNIQSCSICRHAKRLLKYGFDLGPQFSPDSNLPPDDGDSIPASVRRTAPSNVVLNIADLRNSMLETALEEEDASPPGGDVNAAPELQSLSPQQQQEQLFLSKVPLGDVLGSSQDGHNSSQALAGGVSGAGRSAQDSQEPPHGDDRQPPVVASQGESSAQDGATARDWTDSAAVGGSGEDVCSGHHSTVRQYGRGLSAMRRLQPRPGLASVRFAEEPPDPCEEQGSGISLDTARHEHNI